VRRIVLALAILATSCKHPGSAKLEGRWRGTRAEGVGPAVQEAANTFATAAHQDAIRALLGETAKAV